MSLFESCPDDIFTSILAVCGANGIAPNDVCVTLAHTSGALRRIMARVVFKCIWLTNAGAGDVAALFPRLEYADFSSDLDDGMDDGEPILDPIIRNLPRGLKTLRFQSSLHISTDTMRLMPDTLTNLDIRNATMGKACLPLLPPGLKYLNIDGNADISYFAFRLIKVPLETLIFRNLSVATDVFEFLPASLTTVKLTIDGNRYNDASQLMPNLVSLHTKVASTYSQQNSTLRISFPASLKHITFFLIRGIMTGGMNFPAGLVSLVLNMNNITHVHMKYLPRGLKSLTLISTGNIAVDIFPELPGGLTHLSVTNVQFNNAAEHECLRELARLPLITLELACVYGPFDPAPDTDYLQKGVRYTKLDKC